MQVQLDLIQLRQERSDLLVDVVELLVRVGANDTAGLILQELAGAAVARLEEGPGEALHHDDPGLLEVYLTGVGHQI